jgi:hypothetical protein
MDGPGTLDILRRTGQVSEASLLYWTTSPTSSQTWSVKSSFDGRGRGLHD